MQISVKYGAMDSAAGQVARTWRNLESQFSELQGYVNKLKGAWDGRAQGAYGSYQKKWNDAATDLNGALKEMGSGITEARTNFQTAEKRNLDRWS
jgi:ESAT-6 family protein